MVGDPWTRNASVVLFWLAMGWVLYGYIGYPILLALLRFLRHRPVHRAPIVPPLTVIVASHNGERALRAKLANLLEQDYPPDRYQLIVADDASTDGTPAILAEFAARGVVHVRVAERGGKERAQRAALAHATGEIVIFTDVGTRMAPDGIAMIVRSFADPSVGCVSSTDRFLDEQGRPAGEGLYVRYEMMLRRLETDVHSLVGLSGSFFAARRSVLGDFSDRLPSDFCTLLNSIRAGLRGVADEEACGYYADVVHRGDEFGRKVRTVVRGLAAFFSARDLMSPFRHPVFFWQLLSHKFVRWTIPFAMLVALLASLVLALDGSRGFQVVLALQLAAYLHAALAEFFPGLDASILGRTVHFFVVANASILVAWMRYLAGQRVVMWTPTVR
jgi:glycosyltransferase involved in cell wall biosynthesis